MCGVMVIKMSGNGGRCGVGFQVPVFLFSDMSPEELQRYDGVSMSPVFSTTYHALEVRCGKQVSGSHSIHLSVQAAFATCGPWRVT